MIKLKETVYMVGIKGAGMTGLAQILKARGFLVSGSDTREKFFTDAILKKAGIKYFENFSAKNLPKKIGWAVVSNAYLGRTINNPEIAELRKRKITILPYARAVGKIFNQSFGIAVAGTHGKTTTSAILAFILKQAGMNPTALIGGELLNWKSNSCVGKGPFVLEADEYREQFLNYRPFIIVLTGIDYDHPDYFPTPTSYKKAFAKFKKQLKWGGKIFTNRSRPAHYESKLFGKHNRQNLDLAAQVAEYLGIKRPAVGGALKKFAGIRRRMEKMGHCHGYTLIDDYAHNPPKVACALQALREAYPNRKITAIFQPHTFSRTAKFLKDFAKALTGADQIYLLDVYGSAREKIGKIGTDELVKTLAKLGCHATNLKTINLAVKFFSKQKTGKGILVTMGAGDVYKIAEQLAA